MSDPEPIHDSVPGSEEQLLRINRLCNNFETAWKSGKHPTVEQALKHLPPDDQSAALLELIPLEIEYRRRNGTQLHFEEYLTRFPALEQTWLARLLERDSIAIPDSLGDYQILERIGGGGMGTVYKALHQRMGRTVAIKVLRAEIQRDPELLRRFDREVRTVARLNHPNIVAALDAREDQGIHYLVTEYVAGSDLEQLVRRNGPLPLKTALESILQAARGLESAHALGIIHRDIKPANLLRDQSGIVKILDMGLARFDAMEDAPGTQLTKSGMVMGTAHFMAPEQARDTRSADTRSDLYSLGCTLYYLLTGKVIFEAATSIDTILSHINQPAPSLAETANLPEAIDSLFQKLVAKDPQDRFQSASELIAALKSLRLKPSTPPKKSSPPQALPLTRTTNESPSQSNPSRSWLIGVLILLLVAVPVAWFFFSNPTETPTTPAAGNTPAPNPPARPVLQPTVAPSPAPPTPVTSTSVPAEKFSLEFNGQSSYAHVPTLIPTAGENYTIEVIARIRSHTVANVVSWLGPDWMTIYVNPQNGWGVGRKFNGRSFLISTGQIPPLNETIHIAATFQGSQLKLYLNGRLADTQPVQFDILDAQGGLYIGGVNQRDLDEIRYFDGFVNLVRISRGIRYITDFTPPQEFTPDDKTLILLPFREGRGATTQSLDTPPFTATLTNTRWHVAE